MFITVLVDLDSSHSPNRFANALHSLLIIHVPIQLPIDKNAPLSQAVKAARKVFVSLVLHLA